MSNTEVFILIIIALFLLSLYRVYASSQEAEEAEDKKQEGLNFLAANSYKEDVQYTESGLQYTILQTGTGTVHPKPTDRVKVHYEGRYIDGKVFDSSIKRRKPAVFTLNKVIKGWTEGVQLMVVGEKRRFFIHPNLGYGNRWVGNIPPGSTLIFDVELLAINP